MMERTINNPANPQICRRKIFAYGTPSVTFGDSSLGEGACDKPFVARNADLRVMEKILR